MKTPGNDRTNNRLCKNKKDSFLNCHPCHYICNLRINSTYGIRPAVGHKSWILSHAWHQRLSILHILMGYTLPIKKRYIRYVGKLRSIWIRSDWRRDKRMLANLHLGTKTNVWIWICPKSRPGLLRRFTFAKWPSAECWHLHSFYIMAFSWLSHFYFLINNYS